MDRRLISRWWVALVLLLLAVGVVSFAVMTATSEGAGRVVGVGGLVFVALHGMATVRAFVLPRRRRDISVDDSGAATITSPGSIVWPLVIAWGAMPLLTAAFVWQMVVDLDSFESPRAASAVVVGTVFGLPDWWRLVTGRLHRWRVVLTDDGLTYRGYRTGLEVPWRKIHGVRIQEGRGAGLRRKRRGQTAGVLIDLKGMRPDPVIPIAAFDVPAEQIVEEIEKYRL